MHGPMFLTLDEVLRFHEELLAAFGGQEGVRDLNLLESAIAQPRQVFGGQYLHEDLSAMAAAYLYHIVSDHPFLDGNKRAGTHAALVFLELNGYPLELSTDEVEQLVLRVAKGESSKEQVADFFRDRLPG